MCTEPAITIRNLRKEYATKKHNKKHKKIVLEGINLDIPRGQIVGIIGNNGSGKSTLLSIISGIICADSGTIITHGKIASILELGMGFHQDLTGRENIFIKGAMYGF